MKMFRGKASSKARKGSKTKPCSSNNYWVVKQGATLFQVSKDTCQRKSYQRRRKDSKEHGINENQEIKFFKERE